LAGAGPLYDVALVVTDLGRVQDVAREISRFLGAPATEAWRMLFSTPLELVGRVSASTVEALRARFQPLGVELDVSNPESALFDLFLGECPEDQRRRVLAALAEAGVPREAQDAAAPAGPRVCGGLSRHSAERVWRAIAQIQAPARIVSRDFQRFDVRLDAAPETDALLAHLVASTGMPEQIARKALGRLPLVLHANVRHAEAVHRLAELAELGARASAHLLAFQSFSLCLDKIGDPEASAGLLQVLGRLAPDEARGAIRGGRSLSRSFPPLQARCLQRELERVGGKVRLVLA
jgi:hypothetical protein